MTIDPHGRWTGRGLEGAPAYAGLATFAGLPYTEDPAELVRCDAAVVGAPMDELATDRPGARNGPRAIRVEHVETGGHLEAGIDWSEELEVVDFGDAPVVPADPSASHDAIEDVVSQVRNAGAVPVVLGGDHSVTEPSLRAHVSRTGRWGWSIWTPIRTPRPSCGVWIGVTARRCSGWSSRATSTGGATSRSA